MLNRIMLSVFIILLLNSCATPSEDKVVVYNETPPSEKPVTTDTDNQPAANSTTDKYKVNVLTSSSSQLAAVLAKPMGIAIDKKGFIYIVDQDNNKIVKFSPTGDSLKEWGFIGSAPGEFREPKYLAFNDNNELLVTDTWNQRIQVFNPEGELVTTFNSNFYGPKGIHIYNNLIYVADTGHHAIKIFDKQFNLLNTLGKQGTLLGEFNEPTGIAIDNNSNLYVVDSKNNRIVKIDKKYKFIKSWLIKGWTDTSAGKESWLAYNKNKLYLSDPVLGKIRVFDPEGNEAEPLLENLPSPSGLTIFNDKLYIVDSSNHKIIAKKLL